MWIISLDLDGDTARAYCIYSDIDDCGFWYYSAGITQPFYPHYDLEITPCEYDNVQCIASYNIDDSYCVMDTQYNVTMHFLFEGCYMNQPYFIRRDDDDNINQTLLWDDMLSIWHVNKAIQSGGYNVDGFCQQNDLNNCNRNWFFYNDVTFTLEQSLISGFCDSFKYQTIKSSELPVLNCGSFPVVDVLNHNKQQIFYSFNIPTPNNYSEIIFTICSDYTPSSTQLMDIHLYDENFKQFAIGDSCGYLATELTMDDTFQSCKSRNETQVIPTVVTCDTEHLFYVSISSNTTLQINETKQYGIEAICLYGTWDCTAVYNDTCFINVVGIRGPFPQWCDPKYKKCVVNINGYNTYTPGLIDDTMNIYCPQTETCDLCVINCNLPFGCNGLTITSSSCALVEININSPQYDHINISAPNNNGSLTMNVYDAFDGYIIINSIDSKIRDITINVDVNGYIMEGVNLNAQYIQGDLNVICHGQCKHFDIVCPANNDHQIDVKCNIDCSSSHEFACFQMTVYASNGTHDVNWIGCNDSVATACEGSKLICNSGIGIDALNSEWIWNDTIGWRYKNDDCSNISRPRENNLWEWLEGWKLISIIVVLSILFILIVCRIIYYYKYLRRERLSMYIKKGLVIIFCIETYDQTVAESDREIEGFLEPLRGVHHDVEKMVDLFHDKLNYDIHPNTSVLKPKTQWTKQEIQQLLETEAEYLNTNIDKYDGLIVIASCHGIPGYLCCSDYKTISRLDIHRIFSAKYPHLREIPRCFIYDCCSGSNQRVVEREFDEEEDEEEDEDEDESEIKHEEKKSDQHLQYDTNVVENSDVDESSGKGVDYRLAIISAANPGFMSLLDQNKGSFVISRFHEKLIANLRKNNIKRQFIHEIFGEIQKELHKEGAQHPLYKWNDNTQYIRFTKNEDNSKMKQNIEYKRDIVEENNLRMKGIEMVSKGLDGTTMTTQLQTYNYKQLLKSWDLQEFISEMEHNGWIEPKHWKDLTDEELKNDVGFMSGHMVKFKINYNIWLQSQNDELNH